MSDNYPEGVTDDDIDLSAERAQEELDGPRPVELEVNYEMRDACIVRFQCSETVIEISGPEHEAIIAQQLIEMLPGLFLDAIQQEQEEGTGD